MSLSQSLPLHGEGAPTSAAATSGVCCVCQEAGHDLQFLVCCNGPIHKKCFQDFLQVSSPELVGNCPLCRGWIGAGPFHLTPEDVALMRRKMLGALLLGSVRPEMVAEMTEALRFDDDKFQKWLFKFRFSEDTPLESMPASFVLKMCLGYVYQRRHQMQKGEAGSMANEIVFIDKRMEVGAAFSARERVPSPEALVDRAHKFLKSDAGIMPEVYRQMLYRAMTLCFADWPHEQAMQVAPFIKEWLCTLSTWNSPKVRN